MIKFRVYDLKEKKYLVPDYVDWLIASDGKLYQRDCDDPLEELSQKRFIVEQYTGLKDKNGKKIYGGDIIQCGAMVGVATMFEDLACWCIGQNPIWSTLLIERDADGDLALPTTFIIGNIHEKDKLVGIDQVKGGGRMNEAIEDEVMTLFGFCGCGAPWKVVSYLKKYLEELENHTNQLEDNTTYFLMAYLCDKYGLTDHGSSVGASWLTDLGEEWRAKLEQYTGEEK